jgi:hypothetical protein
MELDYIKKFEKGQAYSTNSGDEKHIGLQFDRKTSREDLVVDVRIIFEWNLINCSFGVGRFQRLRMLSNGGPF